MRIIVIFLCVFYFYAGSVEVYSVPDTGKGQINKEGVKIAEILEAKSEERFMEISMEIDSYMTRFTELYTSGVMDGNDYINIEEREIYLEDGSTIATLRIYTDLENRCLRYKVNMYGETMQSILNYYFCDNFVLISRQNDYYSSWILSETVENDILYSNINKWIIMDGVSYIWQDNGELKETDTNLIPVPSVEEIEEAIKQAD